MFVKRLGDVRTEWALLCCLFLERRLGLSCVEVITSYIEQTPFWEAISSSAGLEIPYTLCNSKVDFRVHRSSPRVRMQGQIRPAHPPLFCISKIHLNVSSHLPRGSTRHKIRVVGLKKRRSRPQYVFFL